MLVGVFFVVVLDQLSSVLSESNGGFEVEVYFCSCLISL